jgi:uncharacterized 2Fe-2S/4Fe-4S cluster protein (DUF4445 family)
VSKPEITYLPFGKSTRVPEGTSLFSAAHWIGLPIESTCGGRGTCGKCKVRIEGGGEVSDADHRLLTVEEIAEGWRLSCKVHVERDTVCHVPELMRVPKAATMGLHRMVVLEPNVIRVPLRLPPATLEEPESDVQRLRHALDVEGYGLDAGDAATIRTLPDAMRDLEEAVAVLCGEHLVQLSPADSDERMYGVAVDLGTTTVVGTLMDLATGMATAVESTLNRQAPYGADVISRISHAMTDPRGSEDLRQAAVDTINGILADLIANSEAEREHVYELVLVGNATMLHLLLGVDAEGIARSPFAPVFADPLDLPAAAVGLEIHPRGRVQLLPSIGAYVGADIVGGLLATGVARDDRTRLFIDVGTNGEIALGTGDRTVATSGPAGPAFEGAQIRFGMRAAEGAIETVVLDEDVHLQVIGGDVPARGICGSGLIDAAAQLRIRGLLSASGLLMTHEEAEARGHPLAHRLIEIEGSRAFELAPGVALTQLDIRELQLAKASIATGIAALLELTGIAARDLEEVLLAGSFGTYINPESARVIGLVPPVPVERIVAAGNAAGEGAKMSLLSFRERQIAFDMPERVEYVELSARPGFNEAFVAATAFPDLEEICASSEDRAAGAAAEPTEAVP